MTNVNNPQPYRLSFHDAVEIWLMHWDGVFQHAIASHFGVNQGRVNEVLKGHKHKGSRAKAAEICAANDNNK